MHFRKLLVGALASASTVVVGAGLVAPAAHAYGAGGGENVWQIGLSYNCNSASACGGETGGFWGWAEFDQPTSMAPNAGDDADAQLAGCGHTIGGVGGPGGAGAGHFAIEATGWVIAPGSAGPRTFFLTGGTQTFTGHGSPVTTPLTTDDNPPAPDGSNVVTPSNPLDTGIPADPGHYSTQDLFGFRSAGVAIEIQVAYRPAH